LKGDEIFHQVSFQYEGNVYEVEIGDPLYISALGFLYPELFLPFSEFDHENRENTFEDISEKKKEKKKKERKSIDEMIIDSIEKSEIDILTSNKKKAKVDILLVGGNSLIPGLQQTLETKLTEHYTKKYPEAAVKVNVMTTSSYFEPKFSSWKGASIVTLLESSK
jgi:actin-related protein